MEPLEREESRRCPVCGTALPEQFTLRRCPNCGAKTLWGRRESEPRVDFGVVLFNARLCGIMAGIQLAMIALMLTGASHPVWWVTLSMVGLPVLGYIAGGAAAQQVPRSWRTSLLVIVLALNAGLLAALISAVLGIYDILLLAGIVVGVGALLSGIIRTAITRRPHDD